MGTLLVVVMVVVGGVPCRCRYVKRRCCSHTASTGICLQLVDPQREGDVGGEVQMYALRWARVQLGGGGRRIVV